MDSARLNGKNNFDSNPLDLGRNIPFDSIPAEKDRRGKFGQIKVTLGLELFSCRPFGKDDLTGAENVRSSWHA